MEQKPVLDVNEVPKPENGYFKYTTFVRDVWINSACSVFNRIESISSINIKWIRNVSVSSYNERSSTCLSRIIIRLYRTDYNSENGRWTGAAMLGGLLAGLVYILISLGIKKSGSEWIMKLLPPIVVGPVVMVIGLALAHTAVNMAMNGADGKYSFTHFSVALVTLAITIICSIFGRGFFSIIPVLLGIIGGYIFAYFQGLVDLKP